VSNRPPYLFRVKVGLKWMLRTAKEIKQMERKLQRKLEITF